MRRCPEAATEALGGVRTERASDCARFNRAILNAATPSDSSLPVRRINAGACAQGTVAIIPTIPTIASRIRALNAVGGGHR